MSEVEICDERETVMTISDRATRTTTSAPCQISKKCLPIRWDNKSGHTIHTRCILCAPFKERYCVHSCSGRMVYDPALFTA